MSEQDEFYSRLCELTGLEVGPPQQAPDEVNVAMVRHWCEAMGDANPVYLDPDAAAASVHGGLVAPPTMLQAWVMGGLAGPPRGDGPYERMNELLFSRGFTSVVATDCEQTYHRYLRPGDRLTMRTTIESISPQKATRLGTGHFVTTRQDYHAADGELVGSMLFRIVRFRPAAAAARPPAPRPRPALTRDNEWWFAALFEGRLLIQRCAGCGRLRHPPGPMCAACRSLQWDHVDAPLAGKVHSFVVTHQPQVAGFDYPLPIVLVDLDPTCGQHVRMVMNADIAQGGELAIDTPVRIEVRPTDPALSLPFAVVEVPSRVIEVST